MPEEAPSVAAGGALGTAPEEISLIETEAASPSPRLPPGTVSEIALPSPPSTDSEPPSLALISVTMLESTPVGRTAATAEFETGTTTAGTAGAFTISEMLSLIGFTPNCFT